MTTERHRTTHERLTSIRGSEPWTLPDLNRVPEGPRATEILKTMSQRAAAEHLGISRRQLSKMIEAEGQALDDDNPFSESLEGAPTMTRAGAVASLAGLGSMPKGISQLTLHEHTQAVYGPDYSAGTDKARRQVKSLRETVMRKHPTTLFAADYVDPMRAESQRRAIVATVSDLQERLSDALYELAQEFPGGSQGAVQGLVLRLLHKRHDDPVPMSVELDRMAELAGAFKDRNGDAGAVRQTINAEVVDPEWDELAL